MKKALKYLLLTIVAIPLVFLAGLWISYKFFVYPEFHQTSHIKNIDGDYCWGLGCRKQEKTWEEFLPIFADQMQVMNGAVAKLWPGIDFSPMKTYIITKDKSKAWIIDAHKNVKEISAKEFLQKYRVLGYDMEFGFDKNEPMTMYLVVSADEMANQKGLEKYLYLGTYDPILTVVHEGFHYYAQGKHFVKTQDDISRIRILKQIKARVKRMYIGELFRKYLLSNDKKEKEEILAKASYIWQEYKKQNPKEYKIVKYFDTVEGTAYYMEVLTSLVWKNKTDNPQALQKELASMYKFDDYFDPGASDESYYLGAMAGFVLDEQGHKEWQKEIQTNPNTSPVIYLLEKIKPQKNEIPDDITQKLTKRAEAERDHGLYWSNLIRGIYNMIF